MGLRDYGLKKSRGYRENPVVTDDSSKHGFTASSKLIMLKPKTKVFKSILGLSIRKPKLKEKHVIKKNFEINCFWIPLHIRVKKKDNVNMHQKDKFLQRSSTKLLGLYWKSQF